MHASIYRPLQYSIMSSPRRKRAVFDYKRLHSGDNSTLPVAQRAFRHGGRETPSDEPMGQQMTTQLPTSSPSTATLAPLFPPSPPVVPLQPFLTFSSRSSGRRFNATESISALRTRARENAAPSSSLMPIPHSSGESLPNPMRAKWSTIMLCHFRRELFLSPECPWPFFSLAWRLGNCLPRCIAGSTEENGSNGVGLIPD